MPATATPAGALHMTVSAARTAKSGRAYTDRFLGLRVRHTLADGTTLDGVVEEFRHGYPVIRFPDGRWARADLQLKVIGGKG